MISNLLLQHNIYAHIDGEYLQGAVGEIPAMGVVRLMVNNDDYEQTMQILADWDKQQPSVQPLSKDAFANQQLSKIMWFILGFFLGVFVTLIAIH